MDRNRFKREANPQPTATEYPAWNALPGAVEPATAPPPPTIPVASSPPVAPPPSPAVPTAAPAPPPPDVTIEIKLPSITVPRLKPSADTINRVRALVASTAQSLNDRTRQVIQVLRRYPKKIALIAAGVALIAAGSFIGLHQLSSSRAARQASAAAAVVGADKKAATLSAKPTYQPLVPKSEPALAVPKAGVSAFDSSRSSYTYIDKFIGGSTIQVSEQPLPAQFTSGNAAASSVAKAIQATATTSTTYSVAFIATNEHTNAQTIVFATNKLLIFIQSPYTYSSSSWQQYINNLK